MRMYDPVRDLWRIILERRRAKTERRANKSSYKCPHCSVICNRNSNFKVHLKTHSEVREKRVCSTCSQEFSREEELRRHVKVSRILYNNYTCSQTVDRISTLSRNCSHAEDAEESFEGPIHGAGA